MGLVVWIVPGLIAGALAKLIMPGPRSRRLLRHHPDRRRRRDGRRLHQYQARLRRRHENLPSLIIAVAGSVLLLAVFRALRRS